MQIDKILVYPTDTIYGLHTSAFNKKGVEKIYQLKGRIENKPFIILISELEDLKKFGVILNQKTKDYLEKLWPGPVSVILEVPSEKFKYLHRGTKTLAFRIPKFPFLQKILKESGPLVSTSVNPAGQKPAKNIKEAQEYFGKKVDIYIDRGELNNPPSTVIKIENGKVEILR